MDWLIIFLKKRTGEKFKGWQNQRKKLNWLEKPSSQFNSKPMNQRFYALDIFRGLTIAGMILVNNPGSWSHIYPPLRHASWHGATPTDWIFPFFLFIVGVAIPLALGKRLDRGDTQVAIVSKIIVRALIIFGLGLFLGAFPHFGMRGAPNHIYLLHYILLAAFTILIFMRGIFHPRFQGFWGEGKNKRRLGILLLLVSLAMAVIGFSHYDFSHLRIPGVLQRIAVVYAIGSLLFLYFPWKAQLIIGVMLLLGYWALQTWIPVPDGFPPNLEPNTSLAAWLDRQLLGNHLWSQAYISGDPEGLLSTLPAIATGISGMLTGLWLKTDTKPYQKLSGLLGVGAVLLGLGFAWHSVFPINKPLWTSSYVLYTSGLALLFLGLIYWLTDILKYQSWARPFEWYGKNALFVFIFSGLFGRLLYTISFQGSEGMITLKAWIYSHFFTPFFSPVNASLAYAIAFVGLILVLAWVLFRKKVFIKV
jgi:predicted acyltransferase